MSKPVSRVVLHNDLFILDVGSFNKTVVADPPGSVRNLSMSLYSTENEDYLLVRCVGKRGPVAELIPMTNVSQFTPLFIEKV